MKSGPSSEILSILEQIPDMNLVLSPELIILTAGKLYLEALAINKNALICKHISHAFLENSKIAGSVQRIHHSLLEVLNTKEPHYIGIEDSGLDKAEKLSNFIIRYCKPSHAPIFDGDGKIRFILQMAGRIGDSASTANYLGQLQDQHQDLLGLKPSTDASVNFEQELKEEQEKLSLINSSLHNQVFTLKAELSRSEQRYRSLIENSPVAMQVFRGNDLKFELVNKSMLEFLGKSEAIIGKPLFEGVPEIVGQPIVEKLLHVLKTGEPLEIYSQEVTLIRGGKAHTGFYDVIYRPILDNGNVSGILGIAIDVTVKVLAQRSIEESEEKFRALLLLAPVAMNVFSSNEFVIELANEKMMEIWGKDKSVIGKPLAAALPEFLGQPFFDILQQVFISGKTYSGNESMVTIERDGVRTECYFNLVFEPIRNERGSITAVLHVANEVTEQVKSRKELTHSQERMEMAMDAAKLGSFQINPENRAFVSSPQLKQFFGYLPDDELPYGEAVDRIHPDYQDYVINKIEATIKSDEQYIAEYPIIGFRDQKTRWVRAVGGMQMGGDGNRYFIGIINEITEQKHDEQRKNDFISMVSHELKTPLTSLNAYVQLLERIANDKEDVASSKILEKSHRQVKKMTTMIDGFLNVSRLESGKIHIESQEFDMADLVRETEEETLSMYTSHQIIFAPVLKTIVLADRNKIGQVINNFISNAVKYSANQSVIRVACVTTNGCAQVSVSDQGLGISLEETKKLFERFYRSPNVSQGTIAGFGIGLYLSAEIIQRHNGTIWVESDVGKGSTFYFSIPLMR